MGTCVISKVGVTWTQALQCLTAVDLTARWLHVTVSRGMCSEERWAQAWATSRQARSYHATPNSSQFRTYELFSSDTFHVRLSGLPHVAADNWSCGKRNCGEGDHCVCLTSQGTFVKMWLLLQVSAPHLRLAVSRVVFDLFGLIVCLFVQLFVYSPWQLKGVGSAGAFPSRASLKVKAELWNLHNPLVLDL